MTLIPHLDPDALTGPELRPWRTMVELIGITSSAERIFRIPGLDDETQQLRISGAALPGWVQLLQPDAYVIAYINVGAPTAAQMTADRWYPLHRCTRCGEREAVSFAGLCDPCDTSGGTASGSGWDLQQQRIGQPCGCVTIGGSLSGHIKCREHRYRATLVAEVTGHVDAEMRGHRTQLTVEDLRSRAAGFRVVIPNHQTVGYSYASTGIDCSSTVGRFTAEHGEVYQDDFATLEEAQAYVAGRLGVARDSLRWVAVQDGRGIPGWDCEHD